MPATSASEADIRPWLANYPSGIEWDAPLDDTPVHERVLTTCARQPHDLALDFLGKRMTFAQLAQAIEAFAGALQQKFGVTKGTRVALMLPNTPFYVIAYFGVLRAGGTVVNCNPLYAVGEVEHIMQNAKAKLIVTLDLTILFEKVEKLITRGYDAQVIACHFPQALPTAKSILYTLFKGRELTKVSASPIAARVTWFADLVSLKAKPTPVTIDRRNDVAVQQYTGGTTGLPKGAMLSHANVASNLSQIVAWGGGVFTPPARVAAVLPFFHIFAMTTCMNIPLSRGIPVIMLPRFEMRAFLDMMTRTGASILLAVPTLIHALAKSGDKHRAKLASITLVVSGGAPLSDEIRREWKVVSPARLAEGYGLTEASPVVCCAPLLEDSSTVRSMSIGQPLPGTDIRFVDVDSGEVVALGERGELQVRGPQVMLGYFDDPEASQAAFQDGWLRTGDVGYMDEQGFVFLVDRIKDLIICSGFNVYPRTIEEAIARHPAVDENNVIGVPDEYRGEAPVAFVKLRDGATAAPSEIKAFLEDRLSKIEMPREIIFRDSLPKTLIGKLSKKELREEYKQMKAAKREQA